MSDARPLVRLGGVAFAAAGVLYLPLLLGEWRGVEDIGTSRWWLVYGAATTSHFFLQFGLFGLLAAQLRNGGVFAIVAFVVASVGNAICGGIGIVQLTLLPALSAHPVAHEGLICTPFYPPATRSAAAFIDQACQSWAFGSLEAWLTGGALALTAGSIALGISIVRAQVLPRISGVALSVGWTAQLAGLAVALPYTVSAIVYATIAAAYVWIGAALIVRFGPAAGRAPV